MPDFAADLDSRGAPLEYWFCHLHTDGLAFLVDFIVRRRTGQAEVRVSLWRHERGQVLRTSTRAWRTVGPQAHIGGCVFSPDGTAGEVADVRWELAFAAGDTRLAPAVALLSQLRPFDLDLISRPRTWLRGRITVAGEVFEVAGAPGGVTHYWGRRLPDRWHWISAGGFGDRDVAVEAVLMRTRWWGARPALTAGYLWLRQADRVRARSA
ncbi:MAG TPA: hypothetical protein VF163_00480, partial [Micromonosporaceae bacterium]